MGKNFYISDLHFGHENILHFDNRPWLNTDDMEKALISNWNKVVTKQDTVYILGDFCWGKENDWIEILEQLNGNKVLIKGNHDITPQKSKKYFQDVKDYKEIDDNGRKVILCHYPMPCYRGDYSDTIIHLYGHLHTTIEEDFMEHLRDYISRNDNRGMSRHRCNFYNVGCMLIGYTPRTLDEILDIYKKDKDV